MFIICSSSYGCSVQSGGGWIMKFLNTFENNGGKDVSVEDHQHYSDDLIKKKLEGSVTSAAYLAFAQTLINPTEYSGLFKITVTSPINTAIKHILYVWVAGEGNTIPIFNIFTKTNNSTAATTGLYYIRGVYPKTVNNGYRGFLEFYCYNTTQRDIVIEPIEVNNLELLSSFTASSYNATYQYHCHL